MKWRSTLAWQIELTESAAKTLRKLDKPVAGKITQFLRERVMPHDDPRVSGKALTGPLGGLWRYRVGDMRIICEIQDDRLLILVIDIGNRREVYR
jgi:mRNA interferase RelE/StbE